MKEEGDRVYEKDRTNAWCGIRMMQHVCGDDTAVRVGNQHELFPAVASQNSVDLYTHFVFLEYRRGDSEADWHDLNRDDSDLKVAVGVDFGQEVNIRIETDSDAVDEDDRQLRRRCVRPVPVREVRGRRPIPCKQVVRTEGKCRKGLKKRRAVVAEAVIPQTNGCERVDKENSLHETVSGKVEKRAG